MLYRIQYLPDLLTKSWAEPSEYDRVLFSGLATILTPILCLLNFDMLWPLITWGMGALAAREAGYVR